MKQLLYLCFAVLASSHHHGDDDYIRVSQVEEGYLSQLPLVNGVRDCGGNGKFVSFRLEGCSSEGICRLPGNNTQLRSSELQFIPSRNSDALGLRINFLTYTRVKVIHDGDIPNSAVQGGKPYIVFDKGVACERFKGKTATLQYIVYRLEDNSNEICGEADFEVYYN